MIVKPGQVWIVRTNTRDPDPWYYLVVGEEGYFTKLLCLNDDTYNHPGDVWQVSREWFNDDVTSLLAEAA